MKRSFQKSSNPTVLALVATLALACDDHFSTQQAHAACEDLAGTSPGNPQSSFDDCVACYESCGGECTQAVTSPETYVCPDEGGEGGAGGSE
jgi:hypothetical protein